jgi:putative hydrolase of the HAD superfamily
MGAIRNVIFDLGGVLLEWNPAVILERCYADAASRQAVREGLFRHGDWRAFDRGELSEAELIARAGRRTGRSTAELARVLDSVRESLAEKSQTVGVLRELSGRGVPLYCLSNMPSSVFAYVRRRHGFWDAFRGIVISGEVGKIKPDPAIFVHLLERYALAAGESVFIDDLPQNIEAARDLGLHTILFSDADHCRRMLESCLGAAFLPAG